MRSLVPEKIVRPSSSARPSVPSGPSEVEKQAAIRKALLEQPDKEVCYYDNRTILFRLVQSQKFAAALDRLEKNGPAEASIWVCTKRSREEADGCDENGASNIKRILQADESTSLISGMTQSFAAADNTTNKEENDVYSYTFRALPIHMACSCLGRTNSVDKVMWADLERLIAYLAIVYPAGCARRDHEGRLPLHEAIWYNASPCTVSALLMAAPHAVNEQEYMYSHGRYPIALNEQRTGEHQEAVRKLLRLRRKYWDLARQEATLRFKHRTVPLADASITSTSVLAASIADEETLFTTASAFPFGGLHASAAVVAGGEVEDLNDDGGRRILYKATNAKNETGCREPIQPMSWSQLEKRAMLAERNLEQANEVIYILSKQVIEFRAAQKDLQDKLDRYTGTDLGRLVKRLETEKQDLQWQVQRLSGLLLRNGIAIDPDDEASFLSLPPREVKVGEESSSSLQKVNKPPTDKNNSDVILKQQQQQRETPPQQVKSIRNENEHYPLQHTAAPAATNHKSPVLESNENLGVSVPCQPRQAAAAAARQDDNYASHDDDETTENDQDQSYCHYSIGTGSQQSRLEYDMQVLEEMNERVRQLVISESASDYQGKSVHPQFAAARPMQQQQQERSCLKAPPASWVTDCNGSMSQEVNEDEMDKKVPARPNVLSKTEPPTQSFGARVLDKTQLQATTVAAFDVTCSNYSQRSFPISTIDEEADDEGIETVPEPTTSGDSSSGDASGNSHGGSSGIISVNQGDMQEKNAETVSCTNQNETNDGAYIEDDMDSVIAEAVKLNGGNVLSPEMLRLWRETSATSYGLSSEQLQQQQALNGGKGISPEMMRLWRETSSTSFALSAITLPSMFEKQQQQQQHDDDGSGGSSSTDTRENKSPSSKKKSPTTSTCSPTSTPYLVGEENVSTKAATKGQYLHNVYSNNGDCMNMGKAAPSGVYSGCDQAEAVSSITNNQCIFFNTATTKTPPTSLDDMSIYSDDMGQLFLQAAKICPRGGSHGADCAASTCSSNEYSI